MNFLKIEYSYGGINQTTKDQNSDLFQNMQRSMNRKSHLNLKKIDLNKSNPK